MARIAVIGAGVMGVTGAVELQTRGHEVTIFTHQQPDRTLSATVPSAIVLPCVGAWTDDAEQIRNKGLDKLREWEQQSRERFRSEAGRMGSGVSICRAVMAFDNAVERSPYWRDDFADFRNAPVTDLPTGFTSGWLFSTYVVDTRRWIGKMVSRFVDNGGRLTILDEPLVNSQLTGQSGFAAWLACPGIGARRLFPNDTSVYGSRGHLVEVQVDNRTAAEIQRAIIHAPEGVDFQSHHKFEYIVPVHDSDGNFGTGRIVLGGTFEPVSESELFSEPIPDESTCAEIFEKCVKLLPSLRGATIVGRRVGIRPCRHGGIRIERDETISDVPVIAAYGAGSDGISLHLCMRDAANLVDKALVGQPS